MAPVDNENRWAITLRTSSSDVLRAFFFAYHRRALGLLVRVPGAPCPLVIAEVLAGDRHQGVEHALILQGVVDDRWASDSCPGRRPPPPFLLNVVVIEPGPPAG